jgi:pimeloyl-ACP methyl ester carboxylesterase
MGYHRVHYTEWGPRDAARTILCVHGYSGNARDFDPLARALSSDARVVCMDVPGRGRSDWLASGLHYQFPQFLGDIERLIQRLEVDRVDWIGTSMGGLLGMLAAAQPKSRVRRLVMNDVGAFLPVQALREIARRLDAPERFDTLRDVERHLRETRREWGAITDAQFRELARHHARRLPEGGYRLHYDPKIARILEPAPFVDGLHFWDTWQRIECPVLVIRGEHSSILPADVADAMLEMKPEAELVEVLDAGHAPALMSGPEIELVRNFLAPHDAQGGARAGARRSESTGRRAA